MKGKYESNYMKQFKSLDDQLDYLHKEKQVYFQDKKSAKMILLNCNYYNLISCGKVKYALDIDKNSHKYNPCQFEEWHEYFLSDCRVSEYLMKNIIEFERVINSRTAYYLGKLIQSNPEDNFLSSDERNQIFNIIKSAEIKKLPVYSGEESWKYITKMTFGQIREVLFWLINNKLDVFKLIVKGYPFLNEDFSTVIMRIDNIKLLRNHLFHFTPINIYLGFSRRKDGTYRNKYRREAVNFIFNLSPDPIIKQELKSIIKNANKFNKLKNEDIKKQLVIKNN